MPRFKPENVLELKFVSDPVLSPKADLALAVHTQILKGDDAPFYQSHIFLYDLKTKKSKQLTRSAFADTQPAFSPDGKSIAYLSRKSKDDKAQLYLLPLAGGEAECLTSFKAGVSAFAWHPEGSHIALLSRGDWQEESSGIREITDLNYKLDGLGFLAKVPQQLYLLQLKKRKLEQISKHKQAIHEFVFSPDAERLFFIAGDDKKHAKEWQKNLFSLSLKSQKTKRLLAKPGMIQNLSLSPEGKTLVFNAPCRWELFASPTGLYALESKASEPRLLTAELDAVPSIGGDSRYGNYPNKACWFDEDSLVINVNQDAKSALSKLSLSTGRLEPLHQAAEAISSFVAQDRKLLFTSETPSQPIELFLQEDGVVCQLSKLNSKLAKKYRFQMPTGPVKLATDSEHSISYWKLSPLQPRKDRALVVQVHGGPHTNYGYGFFHEFQILAAAGFTVIYGNPRGSSSFGDDFATTILGRYGTIDAEDILAFAKHAQAEHGAGTAPVHLTGGSYGGFMTNWLIGQTDFFRSAVTQRSICNWLSFFGSSDIGNWFSPIEQKGNPWQDTDLLWQQSPLKYVAKVKTPLLLLHSEEDHRCPIEQAEQFYTALKVLDKVDTAFIRIPGEGHELSRSGRPDRRIARLRAIIHWFETHA